MRKTLHKQMTIALCVRSLARAENGGPGVAIGHIKHVLMQIVQIHYVYYHCK